MTIEPAETTLEPYKTALSRIFATYCSLHEALIALYDATNREDIKSSINTILYAYSASVSGNLDDIEFSENPPYLSLTPDAQLEPIAIRWGSLCSSIEQAMACDKEVMPVLEEFSTSETNWEEKS